MGGADARLSGGELGSEVLVGAHLVISNAFASHSLSPLLDAEEINCKPRFHAGRVLGGKPANT